MIDTNKYEGHTPGPWKIEGAKAIIGAEDLRITVKGGTQRDKNLRLVADAPLLFEALIDEQAEVKRLREGRLDLINEVIRIINNKTGERVDADLHDYIIDRLVNE